MTTFISAKMIQNYFIELENATEEAVDSYMQFNIPRWAIKTYLKEITRYILDIIYLRSRGDRKLSQSSYITKQAAAVQILEQVLIVESLEELDKKLSKYGGYSYFFGLERLFYFTHEKINSEDRERSIDLISELWLQNSNSGSLDSNMKEKLTQYLSDVVQKVLKKLLEDYKRHREKFDSYLLDEQDSSPQNIKKKMVLFKENEEKVEKKPSPSKTEAHSAASFLPGFSSNKRSREPIESHSDLFKKPRTVDAPGSPSLTLTVK